MAALRLPQNRIIKGLSPELNGAHPHGPEKIKIFLRYAVRARRKTDGLQLSFLKRRRCWCQQFPLPFQRQSGETAAVEGGLNNIRPGDLRQMTMDDLLYLHGRHVRIHTRNLTLIAEHTGMRAAKMRYEQRYNIMLHKARSKIQNTSRTAKIQLIFPAVLCPVYHALIQKRMAEAIPLIAYFFSADIGPHALHAAQPLSCFFRYPSHRSPH